MKKIIGILLAFSVGSAFAARTGSTPSFGGMLDIEKQEAQTQEGQKHMIEFNANSVPSLVWAFTKDKSKGTSSENDSDIDFDMNYAYTIHPNFQLGGRLNYFTGISGNNDQENLLLQAVGWFNTKGGDLQNSPFLSFGVGGGYAQTYGDGGSRDDLLNATLSAGKRFGMDKWGVKHLTWTPEVALTTSNSTNNDSFDYRQALEFRFIQFSVIW